MAVTLDDAKDAKEEARQGQLRENDAGIPEDQQIDYEEHDPIDVKGHAESLLTFAHIARISIEDYGTLDGDTGLLDLEQNLENAGQYGFDVSLTLADPALAEGQLWVDDPDDEYPNYKIIGDPESDDNDYELRETIHWTDGKGSDVDYVEVDGIGNIGTSSWDGEPVEDAFDGVEYATLTISGRRAGRILGALDTAGQWGRTQEGEVVEGLLEAPPNFGTDEYDADEDGSPRLIGYPELRSDMVGQRGAVSFTFGDANQSGNRSKEVDIFHIEDNELVALTPLSPDDDAYALPTYPRKNNFYWDDNTSADGADAAPETDDGVSDAQEMMSDDDDTVEYKDLTEDEVGLVEDAMQAMAKQGWESVDAFDEHTDRSFEERVVTMDGNVTHDTEDLARITEDLRDQ